MKNKKYWEVAPGKWDIPAGAVNKGFRMNFKGGMGHLYKNDPKVTVTALQKWMPQNREDKMKRLLPLLLVTFLVVACTQETQNKIGRRIQNWTGTNGVLEIYAGDKLVRRFINIDKISTAYGTNENTPRPYRFGYGFLDENFNGQKDTGEKKVYFEFSDYSTSYIFYENPNCCRVMHLT
jgi:hypothetical protein